MFRPDPPPVPERFRVARATLLMDRFMNQFIKFGGVAVILAVFGIFLFILVQVLPLFREARVEELKTIALEQDEYRLVGIDEWAELPFVVQADGEVLFVDTVGQRPVQRARFSFAEAHGVAALAYAQRGQRLTVGTADGKFSVVEVMYRPEYDESGGRAITASLQEGPVLAIGRPGSPILDIDYADAGARKLAVAVQEFEGRRELYAVTLSQRRTLMGRGQTTVDRQLDLTPLVAGTIKTIKVAAQADAVVVSTEEGDIHYLFYDGQQFYVRQSFRPFADLADPRLSLMEFVFGDVTIIATSVTGEVRGYSLFLNHATGRREFAQTKTFAPLAGPASHYAASVRNKAFLIGDGAASVLWFSTNETIRWQSRLDYEVQHAVIGGKYDRLVFLDSEARLHFLALDDPHPESSWRAYFGKLWYEGQSEPRYDWQSTGGSDDFEPKLSLIPLIIGSLKGTLYALLFAVPIALLAAIYTSQFLQPGVKAVVKPTMEIMASLPSVVLGFLAALWLAPLIDTRVPSVLCIVVLVATTALAFGWAWGLLPPRLRVWIRPGHEFLAFFPVMLLVGWLGWHLGPVVERWWFTVTDPTTGQTVADFRLWWPHVTGTSFEQRNSLVVGFMMGFAVIPIIFTIAEDSLSNVPQSLRSGSLALGASRWQTAARIVLPTAAAGIFSALMIGLGRAVGETMIVVMATGNTPIMEWNIFSGMRTLSANIAVELPEAPHHGTLYRTLFLGALVLFVLTFCVNTLAEILRQRIRERFKTVE
jgi:phosphate transport system permease protein